MGATAHRRPSAAFRALERTRRWEIGPVGSGDFFYLQSLGALGSRRGNGGCPRGGAESVRGGGRRHRGSHLRGEGKGRGPLCPPRACAHPPQPPEDPPPPPSRAGARGAAGPRGGWPPPPCCPRGLRPSPRWAPAGGRGGSFQLLVPGLDSWAAGGRFPAPWRYCGFGGWGPVRLTAALRDGVWALNSARRAPGDTGLRGGRDR